MQANFSSALAQPGLEAGPVGFVSQSGLFTGILPAEFQRRGIGLGYLVSTGNESVVDFADVLAFMARDDRVRVVGGYLEGVRDGRKLAAAAQAARERGKPVVLLKVGRTAESAAAAASHTGALAGAYDVYRAALAQWGILEVDTIDELFDALEAFAVGTGTARGDRIGILTNSGGLGVFGADRARAAGMRMAELAPETVAAIEERLFDFASAANPVDFTLQGLTDAAAVGSHLAHIARDPNVDATLAFFGVQKLNVDALIDEIDAANRLNDKPLIVGWMTSSSSILRSCSSHPGNGFISPSSKDFIRLARISFWSHRMELGDSPLHKEVALAIAKRAQSLLPSCNWELVTRMVK